MPRPTRQKKVYRSKRDAWIVVLLWIAGFGMVLAAGLLWTAPEPLGFRLVMAVLMLLSAGFAFWVLYGTYYALGEEDLIIRAGPFRWTVPFESIQEVFPTHNPLSSPACSLDRLRIRFQGARFGIMISPENKVMFLHELAARVPGLQVIGERAQRQATGAD